MRLFVGTHLNASNQAFYENLTRGVVRRHSGAVHAIPSGSAHLTYVFSADADPACLPRLSDVVATVAAGRAAFDIRLDAPQVLLAGPRPRLVYAQIRRGASEVAALTSELLTALQNAHLPLSAAGSRAPHVTLARFSKRAGRSDGRAVSETLAGQRSEPWDRSDRIAHVQVISSTLTPSGPRYEVLAQRPLA
jgi:2'-5' RNA ligase